MSKLLKEIKTPFLVTLVLLLMCGLIYPLLLTGVSQLVFKDQANGSLIAINGKTVGSSLIGQDFSDSRFMKGRPSAVNYNTYTLEEKKSGKYTSVSSGSENYAPSNIELANRVEDNMSEFLKKNPSLKKENIPTDLLTASGSGLDPHISPKSAFTQISFLSQSTGLTKDRLMEIVETNTKGKLLGIFGEETVNVLKVNLQIAEDLDLINKVEEKLVPGI